MTNTSYTHADATGGVAHDESPLGLRNLYFGRFVFAAAWAAAFAGLGSSLDAAGIGLLVLHPAFDAVAAIVDRRSTRNPVLYANVAISTVATAAIAIAAGADTPAVLRVWGAWAILAGAVQLGVAIRRRADIGGQWAMILSGGISVLAGGAFVAQAGSASSLTMCAGYAALGAVFFLVSAARFPRPIRQGARSE